jgi:hypothetical protein
MAQITITIPDNVISDVVDAFATKFGWTTDLGITKANFAKKKVADYIKAIYIEEKDKASHSIRLQQAENLRQTELNTLNQVVID